MSEVAQRILWVGVGGFLGANARYWLGEWVQARWGAAFPWATFLINVSGSFVLGLLVALLAARTAFPHAPVLRLALAVGFLGAYTTFSTFTMETLTLMSGGAWLRAFGNMFGSLAAGMLAVWLGTTLGRQFPG